MYLKQLQYLLIRTKDLYANIVATPHKVGQHLRDITHLINDLLEQLIEHETNGK